MIESERIRNLPPYLFHHINERKLKARQSGHDVIDLGMGNPDQPTPPHIVEKLREVALDPKAHRYSASRGIKHLRKAICDWYEEKFNVELNPETEAIAVIGSKEGISHLMLAILNKGDTILIPNPTYPSHLYSVIIAGGNIYDIPLLPENDFLPDFSLTFLGQYPKPKALLLSYPHNPTTAVVNLEFFEKAVEFAKKNDLFVIHDLAYSEICFDGYKSPSFLQAKGAKEIGMEFCSLSKTYNMAGWRIGFAVGNKDLIGALAKLKTYYDYGIFTPIQVAGITALRESQECVNEIVATYQRRRDALVSGLNSMGWKVEKPKATMYVWARIPDKFQKIGSMKFSLDLLDKAEVAVSPGIGFGKFGEGYVRFALVENEQRIKQAVKNIKKFII
ncbi:MAG: alanine transaminase [bacterium (Candidatus Ratteibacteria) CG_4_10_14_3_um_filter_41_18]|uniref:Aminotransferase n=1 Tax=bacterium (Candidatus Ratteibacteria) CG_4_10_14_3_um_filter_41_18 TaxID=2014287 RepID=A0A2M7M3M0_9BACT|nr:MAG: alanine transaminase [bacterium (Candidatus Ratteibacteria) CG_4_10_14_3_um_filter_41_18]HCG76958.1 alanine transaminase [bacterium]